MSIHRIHSQLINDSTKPLPEPASFRTIRNILFDIRKFHATRDIYGTQIHRATYWTGEEIRYQGTQANQTSYVSPGTDAKITIWNEASTREACNDEPPCLELYELRDLAAGSYSFHFVTKISTWPARNTFTPTPTMRGRPRRGVRFLNFVSLTPLITNKPISRNSF